MDAPRIQREQRDGRTVWIKRYSGSGRRLRMALWRWLARRLGANALLAPVELTASAACATEKAMILHLAALGVRVPQILGEGERELVLSDLGPTLASRCRAATRMADTEALVAAGFEAIADLHRRGGYASQAFARNLTIDAGGVGFIDLEQDPLTVMPLAAAQARDWLMYVHSTARFLRGDATCYRRLLETHLAAEPEAVRVEVMKSAQAFAWVAGLARPFGGRARDLATALRMLGELSRPR